MTTTPQTTRNYLKLPRRWSQLRPHRVQYRLWNSRTRFKTVHAGRRGGKTELAKRKLVLTLWDCLVNKRPWTDPRFFVGGPTRDQIKRIWWKDLKALTPSAWIRRKYESDLCIVTKWNTELWLLGLDKPDRIEGAAWDGGVLDEFATCKKGIWDANIRPAISDRAGWVWFVGVPDFAGPAQEEYENFVERAVAGNDPEWEDFTWDSADILPASEIESMRSGMDPRLYQQETSGRFVKPGGLAFPDFARELHATKPVPYDPALPICWSLDFNINPMCSGVIQHHKGVVRVIDELVLPDTRTEAAVNEFLDRAATKGWNLTNLCVYGDASGSARDSTSGTSDWVIIRNMLRSAEARFKVPAANPPIKNTVNAVNARLLSADGKVSVAIDPSCKLIASNLKNALAGDDFKDLHALAWFRYFVHREYPIRSTEMATDTRFATI